MKQTLTLTLRTIEKTDHIKLVLFHENMTVEIKTQRTKTNQRTNVLR